jgi:bifunctional NMN adenylyltransferase/nudix hydrolase
MKKLAIFIGRFSPVHKGHINVIQNALKTSDKVLILVGSSNAPRDIRNPWTFKEREEMLRICIHESTNTCLSGQNIAFEPLEDFLYQDNLWSQQVQKYADKHANLMKTKKTDHVEIKIHGHDKDETTWYIKSFPQWGDPVMSAPFNSLNATDIRKSYFNGVDPFEIEGLTQRVQYYLTGLTLTEEYKYIQQEFAFQKLHDEKWSVAPYAPTFNTVDTVVVQSGHILLIERKQSPCKGTWALPGGYLNPSEFMLDGALRELREETGLKVPEKVLRGCVVSAETFDDPKRSTRGRIVTRAFYIQLNDGPELPHVKGGDDAAKAKWFTLNQFLKMRNKMFEDHYHIVRYMVKI